MSLPMIYEASYVVQDLEGDPKRTFIWEPGRNKSEESRYIRVGEQVLRSEPTALDIHLRLLRPTEVRKIVPFNKRLERRLVRMAMTHIYLMAEFEKMEKSIPEW